MNDVTSHLKSLLCKSSISKYTMVRRIINENIKKKKIKLISNYYYGVVVYGFTHI